MDNNHDTPISPGASLSGPPTLSPRRLAAHRANAQKCTGPRTPEGKEVARLNALKHGFFACDVVNPQLDGPARFEEFNLLLDALLDEYQPQSAIERMLVDEVAASCWRIRRVLRYECREAWSDEDEARRYARTETPTESLLDTMGIDNYGIRSRKFRKLRRSGLDSFVLPSDCDVDKIVRFERIVKRNLYRALKMLERIRAARRYAKSSAEASSSQTSLSVDQPLLPEKRI